MISILGQAQPDGGLTHTQQLLADDPLWLIIIKVIGLFALGVVLTLFMINWERKVVGRMQQRAGPNRVGPNGWLQSLADGLKLAFKEDIMPVMADKRVYFIAPVISTIPAFVAFSVIPFGGEVTIFGEPTVLQLVDLPVGVLVVLACSAVGVYGIVLGGWSSGSPYPLLAALRSAAQVISYEIALGLSVVGIKTRLACGPVPDRARHRPQGLQLLRVAPGQPRGDDPRHVREHPPAQPMGPGDRGWVHPRLHRWWRDDHHLRGVRQLRRRRHPLVILAGKEYGSGSSRDWAAKGTALLGVRAVIAESYERIHRSNLIGMGVLPLQFPEGHNAESLGLTGEETFDITGLAETELRIAEHRARAGRGHRVGRPRAHRHPRRGGLLPPRRDHAVRAAAVAGRSAAELTVRYGEESIVADALYHPTTPEIAKRRKELAPHTHDAFEAFSRAVFADGALPEKTKQLIAVAVAHTTQCPYCIRGHTRLAHRAGATDEEIMEAIWVAAEMRAGGAYAHSTLALEALSK